MGADTLTIEYSLKLTHGGSERYVVILDGTTMGLRNPPPSTRPEWTRLAFHQCPNCPLDRAIHSHCPVALGLVGVIEMFKNRLSHEMSEVTVRTPQRIYVKTASFQEIASSLMGLHMATGGCPILDKLRPMAYTHLPFASIEETLYRSLSMYLLAQFQRWKRGHEPDWELSDLVTTYEAIRVVNLAFGQRIMNINTRDANLNALVNLDGFAGMTSLVNLQEYLDEVEAMFSAYLSGAAPGEPEQRRVA